MLYIVLILVLAALGLVVAALVTANSLWAWISIGLSVVAGLLLLLDWLRRRSKRAAATDEPDGEETETTTSTEASAENPDTPETSETSEIAEANGQTTMLPSSGELRTSSGDPAEEQTDAADLLIVSELDTEVFVVDEHPRYHLTECAWLRDRDTIPLPAKEARELGFTPCAMCRPDANLAERHRGKRKSKKG